MHKSTVEFQSSMTPASALQLLKEGNGRFVQGQLGSRDYLERVQDTSGGQWPFAAVLSCIDSRVPAELVFDQGIGDVFSVRIAGNVVNEDIVGSLEFSCKVAGAKLIVVLGHERCGAVMGACDGVKLGSLTGLLEKIEPAIEATELPNGEGPRDATNRDFVQAVAVKNAKMAAANILEQSEVLAEMHRAGQIDIVGAMYDVATGKVRFL